MQNLYFSWKIMDYQACTPIKDPSWPLNSLDEMATPLRIFDRGVDFWYPKSIIFGCMQRNRNFFQESSNAHRKSMSPVDDSQSHPRILSTKRPLHFGSSIRAWIFEAPNVRFLSVCNEIITFSWIRRMYLRKTILSCEFLVITKLRGAYIALYRPEVSSWLSSGDVIIASDRCK